MDNQTFCYWLQGYFEISQHVRLTKEKIQLIEHQLDSIAEPLGDYTHWLKQLLYYLHSQNYKQALLDYFIFDIKEQLNLIFYHVIDNSYQTEISRDILQQIHDGPAHDK